MPLLSLALSLHTCVVVLGCIYDLLSACCHGCAVLTSAESPMAQTTGPRFSYLSTSAYAASSTTSSFRAIGQDPHHDEQRSAPVATRSSKPAKLSEAYKATVRITRSQTRGLTANAFFALPSTEQQMLARCSAKRTGRSGAAGKLEQLMELSTDIFEEVCMAKSDCLW